MIKLVKINETYFQVNAERDILQEMHEHFSFEVPGAKFTPKYKAGLWSGQIHLLNLRNRSIYLGLLQDILDFAEEHDYEVEYEQSTDEDVTIDEIKEYAKELQIQSKGTDLEIRDYQFSAVFDCLKYKRQTLISPTSSGKSLIIYLICRFLLEQDKRILIIVPTTQLVLQMYGDFVDYSSANGWSAEENCHQISAGKDKHSKKNIVISTWQSLNSTKFKADSEYLNQFDVITIDECIHPDSLILTDRGNVEIKDVKIDDLVMTLNEDTNQFEYKPLVKIHKNLSAHIKKFKVTLESGETIIGTANHKVLTRDGWKRIDELTDSDELKTINN